jgi:hypothetical protein
MFSLNTRKSKSGRSAARAALAAMLCLVSAFLFIACPMEGGGGGGDGTTPVVRGNLVNTWENVYAPGTEYEFTTTIKITSGKAEYGGSYEGTIVNKPDFTATDGVLIIRITKYATNYDGNPVATHANVGKFCGLYWKGLTPTEVYLADAYAGYDHALFDTQPAAAAAFTLDKVGDYINWGITAPYTKK